MATTFKLLGIGTLTSTSAADIVASVTSGSSVLMDNLVLFNRGSSVTVSVEFVRASPAATIRIFTGTISANNRVIIEPITLSAGDKLQGLLSATGTVDFAANGIAKDV